MSDGTLKLTAGNVVTFRAPSPFPQSTHAIVLESVEDRGDIAVAPVVAQVPAGSGPQSFITIPSDVTGITGSVLVSRRTVVPAGAIEASSGSLPVPFFRKVLKQVSLHQTWVYYDAVHDTKHVAPYNPETGRVPYGGRVFGHEEMINLIDSSLDFWLTAGPWTERFEKDLAKTIGARAALLVNSGSSANLLAFATLTSPDLGEKRIKRGDEVITVAAGFPTTVAPVIQFGAVPVFVDVSLPTYNIDVTRLEAARSEKTKAVMVAHTLGNPFNLAAVKAFCDKHGLWLIEDNCDALGSRYKYEGAWRMTGSVGHIGTSSFYPPHHLTMGEGGAVYTSDLKLKKIAESFRDWGRDCWCPSGKDNTCGKRFEWQLGELPQGYDHKYTYRHLGYNLKATDMQAAIGVAQLARLAPFTEARRKNWQFLRDSLADLGDYFVLPEPTADSEPSWFGFLLTVKPNSPKSRDEVVAALEEARIQTRMLFGGNLLRHPAFDEVRASGTGYRVVGGLETTDRIMNHAFWLGVFPGMKPEMLKRASEVIHGVFKAR